MNKKELKQIGDFLSPEIAKTIQCLEGQLDKHFIETKNLKKSDYLILRKIVTNVLIQETIPSVIKKVTKEYINYCLTNPIKARSKTTKK